MNELTDILWEDKINKVITEIKNIKLTPEIIEEQIYYRYLFRIQPEDMYIRFY